MGRLASAFRVCFAWGRRSRSIRGRVALLEGRLAPSPTQIEVDPVSNLVLSVVALALVGVRRLVRRGRRTA